jgi:predicted DNA-binding protein
MQTYTIPNEFEHKLGVIAKTQDQTIDQILNRLISEYLEDIEDARLAEAALQRLESGESTLVDWEDAKRELHALGH